MATTQEYYAFIMEQLSELREVSSYKMMGEYVIYYKEKVVGGIYDNRFLIKPTASAKQLMPDASLQTPYPGAKPMLMVDNIDNRDFLKTLLENIWDELPAPKPKK